MPERPGAFIGDGDVAFHMPRTGQRFSLDVADEVFPKMGKEAIGHAVKRLGEEVVQRHQLEIRDAVYSFIMDREWAEPIIREAIRETVRSVITEMLMSSDFAQASAAADHRETS